MKLFFATILLMTGFSSPSFAVLKVSQQVLVDVRTPEEYNNAHIKGALLVDFRNENFKTEISKLNRTDSIKVYCRSGNRSAKAQKVMLELGFTDVENLGGLAEAIKKINGQCEGPAACQ